MTTRRFRGGLPKHMGAVGVTGKILAFVFAMFALTAHADSMSSAGVRVIDNNVTNGVISLAVASSGGSIKADINSTTELSVTASTVSLGSAATDVVRTTGLIRAGAGAIGTPGFSFDGDTNTGVWNCGADCVSLISNGAYRIYADTSQVEITGQLQMVQDGTSAAPTYSFNSDTNSGLYRIGADSISLATGGAQAWVQVSNAEVSLGASSGTRLQVNSAGIAVTGAVSQTGTGGDTPHDCVRRYNNTVGGSVSATCVGSETAIAGGCDAASGSSISRSLPSTLPTQGWNCQSSGSIVQAMAICCSI